MFATESTAKSRNRIDIFIYFVGCTVWCANINNNALNQRSPAEPKAKERQRKGKVFLYLPHWGGLAVLHQSHSGLCLFRFRRSWRQAWWHLLGQWVIRHQAIPEDVCRTCQCHLEAGSGTFCLAGKHLGQVLRRAKRQSRAQCQRAQTCRPWRPRHCRWQIRWTNTEVPARDVKVTKIIPRRVDTSRGSIT